MSTSRSNVWATITHLSLVAHELNRFVDDGSEAGRPAELHTERRLVVGVEHVAESLAVSARPGQREHRTVSRSCVSEPAHVRTEGIYPESLQRFRRNVKEYNVRFGK